MSVDTSCCASCGVAEIDEMKLVSCDDCDLVRYCSDDCQQDHKSQHEEECKKRAAELRDELLFKQPESTHKGECPICCVPLPHDGDKATIYECCSKEICNGCVYADFARIREGVLKYACAFCREPIELEKKEYAKRRIKRVEANDPLAMRREGVDEYEKGNHNGAFKYIKKAAQLGDAEAHYQLSGFYLRGKGVEKDVEKKIYHLEEAAIGGHPTARYDLGILELTNDNPERAVKHIIIAAKQGHDDSTKELMDAFKDGLISKEDLAATLRAHQAAVDATKTPQRKVADVFFC